jgi:glycosyltransferase involved in cell wall biosynthesis
MDAEKIMKTKPDLSVLIPARNEMFLGRTIQDVLKRSTANTEVIAVLDGCGVDDQVVPIPEDSKVQLIHYPESIGQRAATNQAAKLSHAKYVMKLDAHCSVDKGFDTKLMDDMEPDWTVIPSMYNLHGFDWECKSCLNRTYQGPRPEKCDNCEGREFEIEVVWKPRRKRYTKYWRFNTEMKFAYWGAYKHRPESKGRIVDVMSSIGACFFMERERFWEIEGLDEKHGSWGQFGTEIACKSWLSGGRHVVNKRTWFAHMFRTQDGFKFPYNLSSKQVNRARRYSNDLWKNNKWHLQKRQLSWLIDKFDPPGWDSVALSDSKATVERQNADSEPKTIDNTVAQSDTKLAQAPPVPMVDVKKGLVYYTDNSAAERILHVCRQRLGHICKDWEIISVSQYPIDFGKNIVLPLTRSVKSLFEQVVAGLKASTAEVIFLCEHDVLYHASHFDVVPPDDNTFYYDHNRWCLDTRDGKAVFYHSDCPSFMCAHRDLLLQHYSKVMSMMNGNDGKWTRKYGYSPPKGLPKEHRIGRVETYMSPYPTIDIRHDGSFTRRRMSKDQFRNKNSCQGWKEAYELDGWGKTKNRFEDFLRECVITSGV